MSDVLAMLARLSEADRRWILEQLSPAEKARLTGASGGASGASDASGASGTEGKGAAASSGPATGIGPATGTAAAEWDTLIRRLTTAVPARVIEFLHTEPAWLAHGVLSAHSWPWKREVVHRLPATLRLEIARLERSSAALSPAATRWLLPLFAQRLEAACGFAEPKSGFESVLARFTRRALP
jgi:hypothetical protein